MWKEHETGNRNARFSLNLAPIYSSHWVSVSSSIKQGLRQVTVLTSYHSFIHATKMHSEFPGINSLLDKGTTYGTKHPSFLAFMALTFYKDYISLQRSSDISSLIHSSTKRTLLLFYPWWSLSLPFYIWAGTVDLCQPAVAQVTLCDFLSRPGHIVWHHLSLKTLILGTQARP